MQKTHKIVFLVILFLLFIGLTPLQAQWYKRLGSVLERGVPPASYGLTPGGAALSHATLDRAVLHQTQQRLTHPPTVDPLKKAVFTIKEKDGFLRWAYVDGTAFALEETYQGKKYLWGVTASHYLFTKPAMKHPEHWRSVRVPFVVQGSSGMNDISLFPLPEKFIPEVTPLHLASETPKIGDKLFSIGYWDNKLHIDEVRTVKQISPMQITTTLDIEPGTIREGTCGSPVFNQAGEVVGMHAGNSPRRREGFVVPAEHIRQALVAYHEGQFAQPLILNGVNLGFIAINEQITRVQLFAGKTLLRQFAFTLRKKMIDYEHLENIIDTNGADQVVLEIEQNPLSNVNQKQIYHFFFIIYNLHSGEISRVDGPTYTTP